MAEEESEGDLTKGWCQKVIDGGEGVPDAYLQVLGINKSSLTKLTVFDGEAAIEIVVSTQASKGLAELKVFSILEVGKKSIRCKTFAGIKTCEFTSLTIVQADCECMAPDEAGGPPHYGAKKLDQQAVVQPPWKKPPKSSPMFGANRNHKKKPLAAPAGVGRFNTIGELNTYMNNFRIKGRCTEKSDIRKWSNAKGEGCLFNFTLTDASGEIKVTAFKEDVDKYFNTIDVDTIYMLHKGRIKFSSYSQSNEITLTSQSKLEVCVPEKSFARRKYDFKNFAHIAEMDVPERPVRTLVDVCCIVTSIGDIEEFTSKAGKDLTKRSLMCGCPSGMELSLTVWNQGAKDITPENTPVGTVLILPRCSVSTYNGRSLSANQIVRDLEGVEHAQEALSWWAANHETAAFERVANVSRKAAEYVTFMEAKEAGKGKPAAGITENEREAFKGDWFTVTGVLTHIVFNEERNPWYTSQPGKDQRLKVEFNENAQKWEDRAGTQYDEYNCRWVVRYKLADYTCGQMVNSFDEAGDVMMGCTAKQMETMKEASFDEAESFVLSRRFTEWQATVKAKEEFYNDEARLKYTVQRIEPLDFVKDAQRLCEEFQVMCQ